MTSKRREQPGDGCRVDAALQLLDSACDDIKEAVYHNGLYGNEFDVLALLVTIAVHWRLERIRNERWRSIGPTMHRGFRANDWTVSRRFIVITEDTAGNRKSAAHAPLS